MATTIPSRVSLSRCLSPSLSFIRWISPLHLCYSPMIVIHRWSPPLSDGLRPSSWVSGVFTVELICIYWKLIKLLAGDQQLTKFWEFWCWNHVKPSASWLNPGLQSWPVNRLRSWNSWGPNQWRRAESWMCDITIGKKRRLMRNKQQE